MARLTFDIIDRCNLRCPSCYHGIHGGSGARMTLDTCKLIVEHCLERIKNYQLTIFSLYNWGDPLLNKELPDFLQLLSTYPIPQVAVSSNLNHKIPAHMETAILRYADVFKFSMSGITQTVYEKYHQGGNIDLALQNLYEFIALREKLKSKTILFWVFGKNLYNTCQEDAIRLFCEAHHIFFSPTRYYVNDMKTVASVFSGEEIRRDIYSVLYNDLKTLRLEIEQSLTPKHCPLLMDVVTDCEGYVMTCCATKVILDTHITEIKSLEQLIEVRLRNDFCGSCFKTGLIGYFRIPKRPGA